jgi:hypothetical protein
MEQRTILPETPRLDKAQVPFLAQILIVYPEDSSLF